MQRSLVLLAFTALLLASSTEARRLWQFPSFGGATTPPAAGGMMPGAGGAGTAPTAASSSSIVDEAVAEAVAAAQSELAGAGGAAAAAEPTAEPAATATAEPAAAATAPPAVATATATATGTPGKPGTATAVADSTKGVAAGATGASTSTAGAGGKTVTAVGEAEEEEEPAAPAGPKVMRPGVYVIADPPPPPKPKPAPVGTLAGAAAGAAAGRNVTAGPPMPTPGKNLMVVLTLMGQQAKDIYKNQKSIRDEVAQAAGVGSGQVYFFNQTTNQDPRTGVTAMSLIMNVDCKDQMECGKAGVKLFNSSSQTRLTDALARNSVSMLPGTFQVYGVQQMGKYKGNETLYENKALTTVKPKTTETELDYNSTLARVFAGMEDEPAAAGGKKGKQPVGALPGDIPLAGTPGLFGNFSIPMDNMSLPQSSFSGMGNATQLSPFGALNAQLPGLQNTTDPLAEAEPAHKAKSSAGAFTAGLLPLVAAAAAVLVL